MVPQFGFVVVSLTGYQVGAPLTPTVARVSASFAFRLTVEKHDTLRFCFVLCQNFLFFFTW
jgi:hypothetical protein